MAQNTEQTVLNYLLLAMLIASAGIIYHYWPSLVRSQPVARDRTGALWLESTDVSPGDVLRGRVRIDDGAAVAIRGVIVNGAGNEQVTEGHAEDWGDRVVQKNFEKGFDQLWFSVRVPTNAEPGNMLHLEISVEYVTADNSAYFTFTNEWDRVTFRLDVPLHSPQMSALRRAGKASLAIVSWLAVVALLVAGTRWHDRRRREPSFAWLFLAIPYTLIGCVWFTPLLTQALRIHAWWFVALCFVVWFLSVAVAALLRTDDSICRYLVVQARIPSGVGDAYRGSADVPVKETFELEAAWRDAGFVVTRKRDSLHVAKFDGGRATMPLPPSGSFGGGQTFEIRTQDETLVAELVTAASVVLGELRWQRADDGRLGRIS